MQTNIWQRAIWHDKDVWQLIQLLAVKQDDCRSALLRQETTSENILQVYHLPQKSGMCSYTEMEAKVLFYCLIKQYYYLIPIEKFELDENVLIS